MADGEGRPERPRVCRIRPGCCLTAKAPSGISSSFRKETIPEGAKRRSSNSRSVRNRTRAALPWAKGEGRSLHHLPLALFHQARPVLHTACFTGEMMLPGEHFRKIVKEPSQKVHRRPF